MVQTDVLDKLIYSDSIGKNVISEDLVALDDTRHIFDDFDLIFSKKKVHVVTKHKAPNRLKP